MNFNVTKIVFPWFFLVIFCFPISFEVENEVDRVDMVPWDKINAYKTADVIVEDITVNLIHRLRSERIPEPPKFEVDPQLLEIPTRLKWVDSKDHAK